jgi:RNA polymerase sigma-70 factor, ECF subfamily
MRTTVCVNDRELLRRTRQGDPEAFGEFFGARRGDVLAYLRARVRSPELAADLMCETFAQALAAVHDERRDLPAVPIAWLITIARNALIDSGRRGRVADDTRQRLAMEPLELSDRDLQAVEEAAAASDLLETLEAALPADQFQAFKARVFDERGYEEIASELKTSASVVRKRVSRATRQVRAMRDRERQ